MRSKHINICFDLIFLYSYFLMNEQSNPKSQHPKSQNPQRLLRILLTSTHIDDTLLRKLGSGVVEVTIAVLFIHPVADCDTVPLIKIVLEVPAAKVPISIDPGHGLKVTPPFSENSGPIILGETLSFTITSCASFGPALDTTSV